MLSGIGKETNPLYYIAMGATVTWILSLVLPLFVEVAPFRGEYILVVFSVWAVLPVAMAFDVGIVRQKYAMPARYFLPLILFAALPGIAAMAGIAYFVVRSRIVTSKPT